MFISRSRLATSVLLVSVAAALAGVTAALPGCSKDQPAEQPAAAATTSTGKLTTAECQKLFDHVMDLEVIAAMKEMGADGPSVDQEMANELRKKMKNDPALKKTAAGCEKDFSREDYDCIMKARTSTAVDICEHR